MNRIEKVMKNLQAKNEKAFIPYIMAGDGGLDKLPEQILFLEKAGATAIELGIPFSDPVADGSVIQAAGIRALQSGTTLKAVIETVAKIRPIIQIPIIFMTYMNPIMAYGIENFIQDSLHAGVDGLILPDLPIEEEDIIAPIAEKAGIEIIRLVTLTSTKERMDQIAQRGNGFIYAVTVNGITGVRREFHHELSEYFTTIKSVSRLPVLAGFGISSPAQVEEMLQLCDGVIVGSKIIELLQEKNYSAIEELIKSAQN